MATFTPNYNLRKPEGSDFVTVSTDINDSMDAIDTALDGVSDLVADAATLANLAAFTPAAVASGWSIVRMYGYRQGLFRYLFLRATRTGATLTGSAVGNIVDTDIITGLPVPWRPLQDNIPTRGITTSTFADFFLNLDGTISMTGVNATGTVVNGDIISVCWSYALI